MIDPCILPISPWWHWHPPVGTFIGVLGGVGVIVPWLFRPPDKMGRTEKAIWTFLMLLLVWLEIRTLYLDRDEHDAEQNQARCEQIERFGNIAKGIEKSVQQSQQQYDSTIKHVDGVLNTTQKVGSLAKENLQAVTGGDSYAYIDPSYVVMPGLPLNAPFSVRIVNAGGQMLTGVSASLAHVLKEGDPKNNNYGAVTDGGPMNQELLGNLGPHDSRLIPHIGIDPRPFVANSNPGHYLAEIFAQNGSVTEDMYFRVSKSGDGRAYRIEGRKWIKKKRVLLKQIDWTEPQRAPK
jgi:hypothetical protein